MSKRYGKALDFAMKTFFWFSPMNLWAGTDIHTRPYQILVTFFNLLGSLSKVVIHLPIQFATKSFSFSFCFSPPQNVFPCQVTKKSKKWA